MKGDYLAAISQDTPAETVKFVRTPEEKKKKMVFVSALVRSRH